MFKDNKFANGIYLLQKVKFNRKCLLYEYWEKFYKAKES